MIPFKFNDTKADVSRVRWCTLEDALSCRCTAPEGVSLEDVAAGFAAFEELKRTEDQSIKLKRSREMPLIFGELDRVEQGIIPQAINSR